MDQRRSETVEKGEIDFFERFYGEGAYHPVGWRLRLSRELKNLRRLAGNRPLGRVLSLGCGDGEFERMLAGYAEHVTALDISSQAIEIAKRNAERSGVSNVDFRCMPLSEMSWDAQFDAVVCLAFLHHVQEVDLPGLLQDAYAHVKPGGFFYSQDPNVNGVLRKVGRVVLGKNYDKYHTPDERELVPEEIATALRSAGFRSVRIGYIDLTLIPSYFVVTKGPGAPFHMAQAVDWVWCHSPVKQWASGFYAFGRKKREAPVSAEPAPPD
jgi:2-polyprenyl-3-methyl-5-hydroxy-6-metoxy-1,4-benzoquinol methylase